MDSRRIKAQLGDGLCFCGAKDIQHALSGTLEGVDRDCGRGSQLSRQVAGASLALSTTCNLMCRLQT
jgi:hypothetical protein